MVRDMCVFLNNAAKYGANLSLAPSFQVLFGHVAELFQRQHIFPFTSSIGLVEARIPVTRDRAECAAERQLRLMSNRVI